MHWREVQFLIILLNSFKLITFWSNILHLYSNLSIAADKFLLVSNSSLVFSPSSFCIPSLKYCIVHVFGCVELINEYIGERGGVHHGVFYSHPVSFGESTLDSPNMSFEWMFRSATWAGLYFTLTLGSIPTISVWTPFSASQYLIFSNAPLNLYHSLIDWSSNETMHCHANIFKSSYEVSPFACSICQSLYYNICSPVKAVHYPSQNLISCASTPFS